MREIVNKAIEKSKYNVANMVTLLNLSMGCFSLICTVKNEHLPAIIFILISTMLDRADGKLARKLDLVSDLGKELDSLSDLISFGVAPAMLIWSLSLHKLVLIGSGVAVVYILAGAYRLARYNVLNNNEFFIGVPITVAGGFLALLSFVIARHDHNPYIIAAITLILSFCMVTNSIKITKR